MNQILLTNSQNIKKKSSGNYTQKDPIDIRKILIFFGIAVLVLAIIIIGVYAFKMFKDDKKEKTVGKPEVSLEQTENQVKIIAKAEAGISKIVYTWNDGEANEVEMNGRTKHEEALEIPEGQNTLKVTVIDEMWASMSQKHLNFKNTNLAVFTKFLYIFACLFHIYDRVMYIYSHICIFPIYIKSK